MLKKIFISAILLIAVLCFVVSLLKGNNSAEKAVSSPDRVAVINIEGTIVSGGDVQDTLFQQSTGVTSGSIMRQIRDAAEDDSVKALLLNINSGGGSATAAEEIGRELKRFKETTNKPIVATMSDMGASAAYWIAACSSDKIYANSTTLTGSIGVYMPYMNTQELFKKIGIKTDKIKSGPYKDILSNDRPMTEAEKILLQNMVNEIYNEFITVVVTGRKMDEAHVRNLADGRIYTGSQAKNLGLVDELGNYYDALAAAGKLAEITPGKDGLPPVKQHVKQQPWEYLLGAEIANVVRSQLVESISAGLQGDASLQSAR